MNDVLKNTYTTRDVARIVGVDARAIQAAIKAGHLNASKFAGAYIIEENDLKTYLEYRETRNNGRRTLD